MDDELVARLEDIVHALKEHKTDGVEVARQLLNRLLDGDHMQLGRVRRVFATLCQAAQHLLVKHD